MANSLKQFLLNDPTGELYFDLADTRVEEQLGEFLEDGKPLQALTSLRQFVTESPWRYWDRSTLWDALRILKSDPSRTFEAITYRQVSLDRAIRNLFRPSPASQYEEAYQHVTSRDLMRLSSEFIPDYLRWAEHIFGNLLAIYWSVERSGGVNAKFKLKSARDHFARNGPESLIVGFDDS